MEECGIMKIEVLLLATTLYYNPGDCKQVTYHIWSLIICKIINKNLILAPPRFVNAVSYY